MKKFTAVTWLVGSASCVGMKFAGILSAPWLVVLLPLWLPLLVAILVLAGMMLIILIAG